MMSSFCIALIEALRAEFGILEFDTSKPISEQIPGGMDEIDRLMIQLHVEKLADIDLDGKITGNELVTEIEALIA